MKEYLPKDFWTSLWCLYLGFDFLLFLLELKGSPYPLSFLSLKSLSTCLVGKRHVDTNFSRLHTSVSGENWTFWFSYQMRHEITWDWVVWPVLYLAFLGYMAWNVTLGTIPCVWAPFCLTHPWAIAQYCGLLLHDTRSWSASHRPGWSAVAQSVGVGWRSWLCVA